MQFARGRSRDDYLNDLRSEAERTWGAAQLEALGPVLESTADALWRLAEAPLPLLGDEPYLSGAGRRRGEG